MELSAWHRFPGGQVCKLQRHEPLASKGFDDNRGFNDQSRVWGGMFSSIIENPKERINIGNYSGPYHELATLGVDGQYDYARAVLQHLEAVGPLHPCGQHERGHGDCYFPTWGLQRIGVASELQCCSLMLSFATTKHERLSTALSGAYALKDCV